MALLSELVTTCEAQRLDTRATLGVFARRLREAGRLSQFGRGRGAAHMTYLDAARFLIACAATDHPERAADAEFQFSNAVFSPSGMQGEFPLDAKNAPTLDVALAKVLEAIADGTIDAAQLDADKARSADPLIRTPAIMWLIVRRGGVSASLRVRDGTYHYQHPTLVAVTAAKDYQAQKPLIEAFDRETHRFRSGKNLTAELDSRLLRAVANLIAGKVEGEAK